MNASKKAKKVVPLSETAPWILYGQQRGSLTAVPRCPYNKSLNCKVKIYLGDITQLEIDAIVNAANNTLLGGGGVDGAIHRAAGPGLKNECRGLGGCKSGNAKITSGHSLPAKHIIHTVGPRGKQPEVLKSSYSRCYEVMRENKLRSIAFPCISTGVYGYPNHAAAGVAIETTRAVLEDYSSEIDTVVFCLFTKKDIDAYHELLPAYFPLKPADDDDAFIKMTDRASENNRQSSPEKKNNENKRNTSDFVSEGKTSEEYHWKTRQCEKEDVETSDTEVSQHSSEEPMSQTEHITQEDEGSLSQYANVFSQLEEPMSQTI